MLEVRNLSKKFGEATAVDGIDFTVESKQIVGVIGQNGAGKTTTFRMILNLLKKDNGEILWKGKKIDREDLSIIGYLPEERGLYPKMTIEDQILFFAELHGQDRKDIKNRIDDWMTKFNVKGKKSDKVKTLSKGNQQKVQLICTLIHKPVIIALKMYQAEVRMFFWTFSSN